TGGDVEEQRVEPIDVVDEASAIRRICSAAPSLQALCRKGLYAIDALSEVRPELGQVSCFRITAGHADDGNVSDPIWLFNAAPRTQLVPPPHVRPRPH